MNNAKLSNDILTILVSKMMLNMNNIIPQKYPYCQSTSVFCSTLQRNLPKFYFKLKIKHRTNMFKNSMKSGNQWYIGPLGAWKTCGTTKGGAPGIGCGCIIPIPGPPIPRTAPCKPENSLSFSIYLKFQNKESSNNSSCYRKKIRLLPWSNIYIKQPSLPVSLQRHV